MRPRQTQLTQATRSARCKYRVRHLTEYRYGELVPLCQNIVRLQPRNTATPTCHSFSLDISPAPTARRDRVRFFGNNISWVSLEEPYSTLKIEAFSEVEVLPAPKPSGVGLTWEQTADTLGPMGDRDLYWVRQYTFDSHYVSCGRELADYARPSFPEDAPMMECVVDLTQRIRAEFTLTAALPRLAHRCSTFCARGGGFARISPISKSDVCGRWASPPDT